MFPFFDIDNGIFHVKEILLLKSSLIGEKLFIVNCSYYPFRGQSMDIPRLAGLKPLIGSDAERFKINDLIARAARSWNPEYPGRKELPRKYAGICLATMILAKSQQRDPQEILSEVCRIKGIDESEVIDALEMLASRIEENDHESLEERKIKKALIDRTKSIFERLK